MYRLIRIMYIQELFLFIKKQGESARLEQSVPDGSKWSFSLSTEMPRQNMAYTNCGLFSCAGAEVLSLGKNMAILTPQVVNLLENNGRKILASLVLLDGVGAESQINK